MTYIHVLGWSLELGYFLEYRVFSHDRLVAALCMLPATGRTSSRTSLPLHYFRAASKGFNKDNPKPHLIAAGKRFCQRQAITEPGHPSAAFPRINDPDGRNRAPRNPCGVTSVSACLSFDRPPVTVDLDGNGPDMTLKRPYATPPLMNTSHHNHRKLCLHLPHRSHEPRNHLLLRCDPAGLFLAVADSHQSQSLLPTRTPGNHRYI